MTALLDEDRVAVILGESLGLLRAFPDKHFDMILTDSPYSSHVHDNFGKERRKDGGKVQDALSFPPMTPGRIAEYAEQYVRLSKGWILCFADNYSTSIWGNAVRDAGGAWVRSGYWVKTSPKPQMTGDRPAVGAEEIMIGHASPDTLEGRRAWDWNGGGHAAVWRGPNDRNQIHPNQKPKWLMQQLLGMFAPENAVVLDPFFGSGTTAIAALQDHPETGERAPETACEKCSRMLLSKYQPPMPKNVSVVGIESDASYAEAAVERIRHALGH